MTFTTDFNIDFKAQLRNRIRAVATSLSPHQDYEASAELLCDKINRMNAMTDRQLAEIGVPRNEIGAHVIEHLRGFDA